MPTRDTHIEQLAEQIVTAMPSLDAIGRSVSLAIYRLLAHGHPVDRADVATRAGLPSTAVRELLDAWPDVHDDNAGRIIGFCGLALREMSHRFTVENKELYTWCAWDALFIPALIGKTASVESQCATTGTPVSMRVSPAGVSDIAPTGAQVSFLAPDTPFDANVMMSFCHYVRFFGSESAGAAWTAEHEGTFLVSVDDAFAIGAITNRARYGSAWELAEERTS